MKGLSNCQNKGRLAKQTDRRKQVIKSERISGLGKKEKDKTDHPAKEKNSKIQKGSHRYYGTMNQLKEAISTISPLHKKNFRREIFGKRAQIQEKFATKVYKHDLHTVGQKITIEK